MIQIEPICAMSDNYVWMAWSPPFDAVVIVDPGDATPVLRMIHRRDLRIAAILITHHHNDHVGGVAELLQASPAPVYGPKREKIAHVDHLVGGGSIVRVQELGFELQVMDVPGHTAGHVAYVGPGFAFVGDTLFAGGCGRVFEGSPELMHSSLRRLAALPGETEVFCAHEYTTDNLRFALEVEPDNQRLASRLEFARRERAEGRPTVPSTIDDELATNPFLRCDQAPVVQAAERRAGRELAGPAEVFGVIRHWKDGWRG
jgi:hydroxyacylglutathione hydrolase